MLIQAIIECILERNPSVAVTLEIADVEELVNSLEWLKVNGF